jgi:hypothetical protein
MNVELGATIVQRYVESYRQGPESATQSAIDLERVGEWRRWTHSLATSWPASRPPPSSQILAARRRTLQFFDGLYVDLHHLAGNLVTATGKGHIADACHDVQRLIDGDQAPGPIIAQGHAGRDLKDQRPTIYADVPVG